MEMRYPVKTKTKSPKRRPYTVLWQLAKAVRGTEDRKTLTRLKEQDTPTKTHTDTRRGFCMPGMTPLQQLPRDSVILTLLGSVVGVRLVVCGGWGIGMLLVTPLAN